MGPLPFDHGQVTDHGQVWLDGDPGFCSGASPCAGDKYCEAFGCEQLGTCERRPKGCDLMYAPVCGCDKHTYGNRCEAQAQGVTVDYEGECAAATCRGAYDCGPKEFCDFFPKGCGTLDTGLCHARPQGCPTIYQPVCGCDGKTYGNACQAHVAGVDDDYPGECKGGPADCDAVLKNYAAALDKAKQCSPMLGVEQCITLVTVSLPCGCETFINGLDPDNRKALDQLALDWKVLGCPQAAWPCPPMPCAVANHGFCGANGRCQDAP